MFRALLDATPHVTWLYGSDGVRLEYASAAFERVFGRPRAALAREPHAWVEVVHHEDRLRIRAEIDARARGTAPRPMGDFRIVRPDGDVRWLHASLRRFEEPVEGGGSVGHWIEIAMDVTEGRRAAAVASREHEIAEQVLDVLGACVVVTDRDGRLREGNDRFAALWEGGVEAVRGRLVTDVVSPGPDAPARFERTRKAIEHDGRYHIGERRVRMPSGEERELDWWAAPLHDGAGAISGYISVACDVTAEKRAWRERSLSEERFRRMGATIGEVFFLISRDRRRLYYVNPAFERVWGVPCDAVYANPGLVRDMVHPDDREAVAQATARQMAGRDEPVELRLEYRIVRPDGSTRWISARTYPVLEEDGTVQGIVGLNTDITERKEAERALRERTEQLERLLREKDVLLAEVHHRVKNNLQSIAGLMHLMAARAQNRPIHETIAEVERRILAMALVHETLYRSASLADVEMHSYLDAIACGQMATSRSARRAITIDTDARGITLDPDGALRCGFIVSELVNNSLKHAFGRRRKGRITVTMSRTSPDRVLLRVADDGKGLPAGIDFASEATLGLRLVQGLAEQLGGSVLRVAGHKSAIEVEFPVAR